MHYRNRDQTVYGKELWKPSMNAENQMLGLPLFHASQGIHDSWNASVAGSPSGPEG